MRTPRKLFSALALFLALSALPALGALKFKDPLTVHAKVGQPLSLDLNSLLAEKGEGEVQWQIASSLPAWLKFDGKATLAGAPAAGDVGTSQILLAAVQGEEAAIDELALIVDKE